MLAKWKQFLARRWSACRCQSPGVCARQSYCGRVSWQPDREWRGGGGGTLCSSRATSWESVWRRDPSTRHRACSLAPGAFFLVSLSAEFLAGRRAATGQSSRLAWCTARTSHPAPATKTSILVSRQLIPLRAIFLFLWRLGFHIQYCKNVKVNKQNKIRNMVETWPAENNLMQPTMRGLVAPIYPSRCEALSHSRRILVSTWTHSGHL